MIDIYSEICFLYWLFFRRGVHSGDKIIKMPWYFLMPHLFFFFFFLREGGGGGRGGMFQYHVYFLEIYIDLIPWHIVRVLLVHEKKSDYSITDNEIYKNVSWKALGKEKMKSKKHEFSSCRQVAVRQSLALFLWPIQNYQ